MIVGKSAAFAVFRSATAAVLFLRKHFVHFFRGVKISFFAVRRDVHTFAVFRKRYRTYIARLPHNIRINDDIARDVERESVLSRAPETMPQSDVQNFVHKNEIGFPVG